MAFTSLVFWSIILFFAEVGKGKVAFACRFPPIPGDRPMEKAGIIACPGAYTVPDTRTYRGYLHRVPGKLPPR